MIVGRRGAELLFTVVFYCVRRNIGQNNSSLANSYDLVFRMRVDEADCVSGLIATKRKSENYSEM